MIRIALLAAALSLPACMGSETFTVASAPVTAFAPSDGLERSSLALVNEERRQRGLEPMRPDPILSRIALQHARDMEARNYYDHVSPNGQGVQDRHDGAGGADWRLVAENIARCSRCPNVEPGAQEVRDFHGRWMGSAGHRENILSPGLDSFGFAAITGPRGYYLVQTFSGPGQPTGLTASDSLAPLSAEAQARDALDRVNAARARAGLSPLMLAGGLNSAIRQTLPRPGSPGFDVRSTGDVQQAIPVAERARWSGVGTIYGACGACGRDPVGADIRFFVSEWLERPAFRSILLNPDATHLGFGIAANGEGRKVALATVGVGG